MNLDVKQERSVPVQGRVDIVELADLAVHLEKIGLSVGSMSKLLNYSINLAHWALKSSGQLEFEHESVESAVVTMRAGGLYSNSMLKRGKKKLQAAMTFENLRKQGVDPATYTARQFNILHNKKSVQPGMMSAKTSEMVEVYSKLGQPEANEKSVDELVNKDFDESVVKERKAAAEAHAEGVKQAMRKVVGKSDAELAKDAERIAAKDKALEDAMNSCNLPPIDD